MSRTTTTVDFTEPVVDGQDLAHASAPAASVEASGKYIGKDHQWARAPPTRWNHYHLVQFAPIIVPITLTWLFNTYYGPRFYPWLNAHYTPFQINTYWTFAITTGWYWAIGLLFMALDMVPALHSRVSKYKVQPHRRVTWADDAKVCKVAAKNQLVVTLPLIAISAYVSPRSTGFPAPSLLRTAVSYVVCLTAEELGFYAIHRAVHSRALYTRVHKLHHTFSAPVALASTYCTPAEHLLSNLAPIVLGILAVDAHWSLTIMFFVSSEAGTLATHSDYNIPGLNDALPHDWHHYSFTENFGPVGLLDELLGTNRAYKSWLAEVKRWDGEDAGWYRRARVELAKGSRE